MSEHRNVLFCFLRELHQGLEGEAEVVHRGDQVDHGREGEVQRRQAVNCESPVEGAKEAKGAVGAVGINGGIEP